MASTLSMQEKEDWVKSNETKTRDKERYRVEPIAADKGQVGWNILHFWNNLSVKIRCFVYSELVVIKISRLLWVLESCCYISKQTILGGRMGSGPVPSSHRPRIWLPASPLSSCCRAFLQFINRPPHSLSLFFHLSDQVVLGLYLCTEVLLLFFLILRINIVLRKFTFLFYMDVKLGLRSA